MIISKKCHDWGPLVHIPGSEQNSSSKNIRHELILLRFHTASYLRINRALIEYCGNNCIFRPPYLHNGIPFISKMKSLCWIKPRGTRRIHTPLVSVICNSSQVLLVRRMSGGTHSSLWQHCLVSKNLTQWWNYFEILHRTWQYHFPLILKNMKQMPRLSSSSV